MTAAEIEQHLLRLGGGNHDDNMGVVLSFQEYCLVELSLEDFRELVFLQTSVVFPICRPGEDRRIAEVASRALKAPKQLGPNWDLDKIRDRTRTALDSGQPIESLLIRETNKAEKPFGLWYLQDGSHRGLGYAMAILSANLPYVPITAYRCSQTKPSGL